LSDSRREHGGIADPAVHAAAAKAIELISDGARIGLGSGRAVAVLSQSLESYGTTRCG
jgi:ribose 5-phosphate isomerase